ncbi:MAG: hypothetical protein WC499_00560 [Patescibacteria group bacterium]
MGATTAVNNVLVDSEKIDEELNNIPALKYILLEQRKIKVGKLMFYGAEKIEEIMDYEVLNPKVARDTGIILTFQYKQHRKTASYVNVGDIDNDQFNIFDMEDMCVLVHPVIERKSMVIIISCPDNTTFQDFPKVEECLKAWMKKLKE